MLQNKLNRSKIFYGKAFYQHLNNKFYMKKNLAALIALLFMSSIAVNAQSEKQLIPPPSPPKPPKVNLTKFIPPSSETTEFLKKNPSVHNLRWSNKEKIIVFLKDGKTEKYNLEDENEKKMFVEKYGLPPTPPPPPPPPRRKTVI